MPTRPAVASHARPPAAGRTMTAEQAMAAFAALGQPTRLAILRALMRRAAGLTAGALATKIGCPATTLSAHLAILARAGLIAGSRAGRTITYRIDVAGMRALIGFLVDDCCDGHPALCGFPAAAAASDRGCAPAPPSRKARA